jgi:hypothetical protein
MDQLGSILLIILVGVVVRVAIVHVGVRANWRTVLYTCLTWFGLALILTGGSRDGIGWLPIALIYTFPAVPIIALALTIWRRLGRSDVGVVATGAGRSWLQRLPFSLASPAQWSAIALLVTGGLLGSYWYEQRDLTARAELAGRFLGLPPGTRFASFQSSNSSANAPSIAAIVRFTKPQFDSFVAQLDQAPPWQKGPPHYDGAPVEVVSPEAITWRDGPLLKRAGNQVVSWNNLSADEMRKFKRGRTLCIALQRKHGGTAIMFSSTAPRYVAKDCTEPATTERVSRIVLGALDFDTRTLHMIIK